MARKLKCQWCGGKSERPEMKKITKGTVNKYYHAKICYQEYLAEEEFKKEEAIQRDSLYKQVMEIYGVKILPNSFYMQIEGVRHGNRVFSKQKIGKRYREGYEYDLIEESYKFSRDSIEWSLKNKAFVNLANALNYGLSIVINNIYSVEKRRQKIQSRKDMEKLSENIKADLGEEELFDDFESPYKKKKRDEDLDFLDMLD